jgi:hypothetical protein
VHELEWFLSPDNEQAQFKEGTRRRPEPAPRSAADKTQSELRRRQLKADSAIPKQAIAARSVLQQTSRCHVEGRAGGSRLAALAVQCIIARRQAD